MSERKYRFFTAAGILIIFLLPTPGSSAFGIAYLLYLILPLGIRTAIESLGEFALLLSGMVWLLELPVLILLNLGLACYTTARLRAIYRITLVVLWINLFLLASFTMEVWILYIIPFLTLAIVTFTEILLHKGHFTRWKSKPISAPDKDRQNYYQRTEWDEEHGSIR
jgi:hypothetical protein